MRKLCIAFLVGLCCGVCRPAPAPAAVSLLVFPPENLSGDPALAWVGEGIALSLIEQLKTPGIATFSRDERLGFIAGADLPPNSSLSRASMIHVGQQASADRLVMGSVTGTSEKLRIVLRVLDLKPLKMGAEAAVEGPILTLPQMENELAWMILANSGLGGISTREKFRERARSIPNEPYALFIQSLIQSDPDERVRLLSQAVNAYPAYTEAHAQLGRHFFEKGDCARSIPHLELAGDSRDGHFENRFKLGTCYLKQGNLQEAIHSFIAILAFVQSPQVLNNLGVAYLRRGDLTLAAESLIEARNLSRTEPTILTNLAIVRHLEGDNAAARSLLDAAAMSVPGHGMTQFVYGIILALEGEQEQSVLALARAKRLEADPEKLSAEDPKTWARPFTTWSGKQVQTEVDR